MAKAGIRGSLTLTKEIAQVKLSACTYNTALAMPQVATEPPPTDTTTGYALIAVGGQNYVAAMFAGTTTGEIYGYQVVGWQPTRNGNLFGSVPEKLGEGLITLGTLELGTEGIFIESAAALWADTITETSSNPATRVYSPANNEAAMLIIDAGRFSHITIQVSRNGQDAATMTVVTQVADSIGGALANIEIADTGLATAANQATETDFGVGTSETQRVAQASDVDLNIADQSVLITSGVAAGTGISVAGDTAFSAGATVLVIGLDTWVAVGDDVAQATGGDIKYPAGVPFLVTIDGTETTFHIDCANGGSVSVHQV